MSASNAQAGHVETSRQPLKSSTKIYIGPLGYTLLRRQLIINICYLYLSCAYQTVYECSLLVVNALFTLADLSD